MFDIDFGTGDGVVSLDSLKVAYFSGNVMGFAFSLLRGGKMDFQIWG
jgi:hypothetical protein